MLQEGGEVVSSSSKGRTYNANLTENGQSRSNKMAAIMSAAAQLKPSWFYATDSFRGPKIGRVSAVRSSANGVNRLIVASIRQQKPSAQGISSTHIHSI